MPIIFISYRRSDSQDVTGRIYDRLVAKFTQKQILKDVDNIPLGVSFPMHLQQMIGKSNVVLVIIGPGWISATDERGNRRLDDPADFVRVEIEASLRANIPVIPVLVSNAPMPKASELPRSMQKLAERNGMAVRPDPDFNNDIGRLFSGIDHLEKLLNPKSGTSGKGKKVVIPTVVPVDDEKIVIEVVREGPPPLPKQRESWARSKRDTQWPERTTKSTREAKRTPEGIFGRLASCSIGGACGGLLVIAGMVACASLFGDTAQPPSTPMFALTLLIAGLFGAAPGFVGGLVTAGLPRIMRNPFLLALIWAPLIGAIPLVFPLASQELPRDFFALLGVMAALGAAYGFLMGCVARLLEIGWGGYLGVGGSLTVFLLLSVAGYGVVNSMKKPAANGLDIDTKFDFQDPVKPTPIIPGIEPKVDSIKQITVRVSSRLVSSYLTEKTTVTIDGTTQTINLSAFKNIEGEVVFPLKNPGPVSYSLTTQILREKGSTRTGTGTGQIPTNEDSTYDVQMNNLPDGSLALSLIRRIGGEP